MRLLSIQTGKEQTYQKGEKTFQSSFEKTKVAYPVTVTTLGITDDFQSDKRYHGGEMKALLCYAYENYKIVKQKLGVADLKPGSMGENLTFEGLDETRVSIGSLYKIGEVVLEVSQPREPCWKVSYFLRHKEATKFIFQTGLTGWYFRVLQEGEITKNDTIMLTEKRNPSLTIEALNSLVNRTLNDKNLLQEAIGCPQLGEPFRKSLEKIS